MDINLEVLPGNPIRVAGTFGQWSIFYRADPLGWSLWIPNDSATDPSSWLRTAADNPTASGTFEGGPDNANSLLFALSTITEYAERWAADLPQSYLIGRELADELVKHLYTTAEEWVMSADYAVELMKMADRVKAVPVRQT